MKATPKGACRYCRKNCATGERVRLGRRLVCPACCLPRITGGQLAHLPLAEAAKILEFANDSYGFQRRARR